LQLFGYSQTELNQACVEARHAEVERLGRDARTLIQQRAPDLLQEHELQSSSVSPINALQVCLRALGAARWERIMSDRTALILREQNSDLNAQLEAVQAGRLHAQIAALIAERDQLRKQLADQERAMCDLQAQHRQEIEHYQAERAALDELLVQAETARVQNAKRQTV
jgi:hypothetical protein